MKISTLYKFIITSVLFYPIYINAQAVLNINDEHIFNQQERMVFKQWDKSKFTPSEGFLGLNYQYWITWALHPNYPDTDRRPLSTNGPQTLRLAMALAMLESTTHYKHHSDTISTISVSQIINYSPEVSTIDPLWNIYYKGEFGDLAQNNQIINPMENLDVEIKRKLIENGVLQWYMEEYDSLRQRLHSAHNTYLDRGSRIMSYHSILEEYRILQENWKAKVRNITNYIELLKKYK